MVVSKRIKAIESLVPAGTRLLDVGSDHAFLPISLFLQGRIAGAVVSDVNEGPLAAGRENVARLAPSMLAVTDFVLSDGFAAVKAGSYSAAAVCGMGGELIADILKSVPEGITRLILQPMTMIPECRRGVHAAGFVIEKEYLVKEKNKIYVIIHSTYIR